MVGRQIGGHGNMRAFLHGHQLEGAEFQHRHILRRDLRGIAQQRMADVAAHMDNLPLRCQQLGDDGGRGGLSVRAGHRQNGAGADLKKASISEVITLPPATAAASSGTSGRRPGCGRSRPHGDPPDNRCPAAACSPAPSAPVPARPDFPFLSRAVTSMPCSSNFFNQRPVGNPPHR